MNMLRLIVLLGVAALGFGQDAVVQKSSVWIDTVMRGAMTRAVRGLGVLAPNNRAELSMPASQAQQIRPGQSADIDTRNGMVKGKVTRVGAPDANGIIKVDVQVESALPSGAVPGLNVDGTVQIEVVKDVIYVGRPAAGAAHAEGTLFKIDADGQHATKVNVRYGRASVQTIEVLSGLQPGDQVILSDTRAFATNNRVRLQ
jgi:HlyD family secretion protein